MLSSLIACGVAFALMPSPVMDTRYTSYDCNRNDDVVISSDSVSLRIRDGVDRFWLLIRPGVGAGWTDLRFWHIDDSITKIELLSFQPYVGLIVSHEFRTPWCIYAEDDFQFWLGFTNAACNSLRQNSESCETMGEWTGKQDDVREGVDPKR